MLRSTCSCILSVISLLLDVRSVFDEDALSIDEYIIPYLHVPVYEGCVHVGEPAKNRWLTPVDGGVRLSVVVFFFLHLVWTHLKPGNNVTVVSLSNSAPTVPMLSAARTEMDWKPPMNKCPELKRPSQHRARRKDRNHDTAYLYQMDSAEMKMQETNISELFKNFLREQMNRITFN